MSAKWVLLTCIGKSVLYHGGKGLLNYWGGQGLGDAVFAEVKQAARSAYDCIRQGKGGAGPLAELQAMARATVKEAQQEAEKVAQEVAADQPPTVRDALTAYLTHGPARRSAGRSPPVRPVRRHRLFHAGLALRQAEDLLRFLPSRLPRFRPGDQPLPGVAGAGGAAGHRRLRRGLEGTPPAPRQPPPVALKFCLDEPPRPALRNEAHCWIA